VFPLECFSMKLVGPGCQAGGRNQTTPQKKGESGVSRPKSSGSPGRSPRTGKNDTGEAKVSNDPISKSMKARKAAGSYLTMCAEGKAEMLDTFQLVLVGESCPVGDILKTPKRGSLGSPKGRKSLGRSSPNGDPERDHLAVTDNSNDPISASI